MVLVRYTGGVKQPDVRTEMETKTALRKYVYTLIYADTKDDRNGDIYTQTNISVHLISVCLCVCLSVCLSVSLCVFVSVSLSVSVSVSVSISLCLSAYLSLSSQSVCLCLSVACYVLFVFPVINVCMQVHFSIFLEFDL